MHLPLVVLAVANLVFWTGYAVYYVATRRFIEESLGEDYALGVLLSGAEEAPLAASLVLGPLSDYLGRRRVVLFGLVEAAAVAAMAFAPIGLWPILAALAALSYALAYNAVLGMVLEESGGSGYRYSLVAAFGSAGWALGGLLGGILYTWGGAGLSLQGSAALVGASYVLVYLWGPRHGPQGIKPGDVLDGLRGVWPLAVAATLSGAGLTVFYGAASLRLSTALDSPLAYGLVLTTLPAILGALSRPIAGKASDALGHERLFSLTNAVYGFEALAFASAASPLVLIAAWLVPVFPFRDVALTMMISTRLPGRLQGTAAGVISFAYSASGLIALTSTGLYESRIELPMTVAAALLLASNLALIATLKMHRLHT